jgi:RHS repeat-associated protein
MQARRLVPLFLLSALCALARPATAGEYVLFYHNDATGSPQAMTDINGNVVWRADYEPFGNLAAVTETLPNTREYIGKQRDLETSLHYFGARYYDVRIGRFLSVDPALLRGRPLSSMTIPQRLNFYAYATNNPYRYLDPDGRYTIVIQGFSSSGFLNLFARPGVMDLTAALNSKGERAQLVQHSQSVETIVSDIIANRQDEPVNIVGHSWGGDTAKEVAKALKEKGIQVNYLGTLDAQPKGVANDVIPDNVVRNKNFYQEGFLPGSPTSAQDPSKTKIENVLRPEGHTAIVRAVTPEVVKDITGQ